MTSDNEMFVISHFYLCIPITNGNFSSHNMNKLIVYEKNCDDMQRIYRITFLLKKEITMY